MYYLEAETMTSIELFSDEQLNNINYRSYEEIKSRKSALIKEVNVRNNENPVLGSRYLYLNDVSNLIPRTDE